MAKLTLILLRGALLLLTVIMLVVTVHTSLHESLWAAMPRLLNDRWAAATLIDFYFNLFLISLWMFYKEKSTTPRILWLLAFIGLGSIATTVYVFRKLAPLRPGDSWRRLWLRDVDQ